ncbi:MAG: hypothetical protein A2756_05565 [Candidatus Ryanbacteria bacterium RIFCSPHIGHO2_01_FULL_48_27]|uniref:Type II secretion system protein GspF domain-containing protein n=1 Tax=Candidatus Ryanbacteria bacterium RIFCSPHIGHO2_01_FULL_48_27 TaxID=1802115 RepID=A0A1G2G3X2_9BACT|nr:MAG: hypothetical protein A2756_05565 [Candidatus Ryanbacteria bacterium RIFCSPHIGHO2_01_FULL_48_27]
MPVYTYRAKKIGGEETSGTKEAKDKRELASLLREEGYILVATDDTDRAKRRTEFNLPSFLGHVSIADKMMFARNLSVMLHAGLSLTKALDILAKQTTNKKFQSVINDLNQGITKGKTFAESLQVHEEIFGTIFVAMVAAGEASGKLVESLKILALQLKNDYELRRRIRGALIYPGVIVVAMMIIGYLMLTYVVPTLTQTFTELKVDLPASTKFIIFLSNSLLTNSLIFLASLPIISYGVYVTLRQPNVKHLTDIVLVRMPIVGTIDKKMNSARTARTLSSLISSGVPILKALEITGKVLKNHLYKDVLKEAADDIQRGKTISQAFVKHLDIYPILVGEMIEVGEETGKTSEMLHNLAIFYEAEVAEATKNISSIIEPVLMIIIGAVVGFFAISMIQPLYTSIGDSQNI